MSLKKNQHLIPVSLILVVCFAALSFITDTSGIMSNSKNRQYSFDPEIPDSPVVWENLEIQESISYGNLQIFPITGTFGFQKKYITLQKALEEKLITMNETSDVNELSLNNNSDEHVFIHSGDIVKGGKQDRTIQYDVIIPPKEKNVPIASFCVEHGRWSQRGEESAGMFSTSQKSLSSRDLKVSSKRMKSQGAVWAKVDDQKNKLNKNLAEMADTSVNVNEDMSPSSLQLTLENKVLNQFTFEYKNALAAVLAIPNLVGLAYAINGEVYGLDVFNNEIFHQLSAKLLDAFIVEAIGDRDSLKLLTPPAQIKDVFGMLQSGKQTAEKELSEKINSETQFKMSVYGKLNHFFTTDLQVNKWVHLNIIAESDNTQKEPNNMVPREDRFEYRR